MSNSLTQMENVIFGKEGQKERMDQSSWKGGLQDLQKNRVITLFTTYHVSKNVYWVNQDALANCPIKVSRIYF